MDWTGAYECDGLALGAAEEEDKSRGANNQLRPLKLLVAPSLHPSDLADLCQGLRTLPPSCSAETSPTACANRPPTAHQAAPARTWLEQPSCWRQGLWHLKRFDLGVHELLANFASLVLPFKV